MIKIWGRRIFLFSLILLALNQTAHAQFADYCKQIEFIVGNSSSDFTKIRKFAIPGAASCDVGNLDRRDPAGQYFYECKWYFNAIDVVKIYDESVSSAKNCFKTALFSERVRNGVTRTRVEFDNGDGPWFSILRSNVPNPQGLFEFNFTFFQPIAMSFHNR